MVSTLVKILVDFIAPPFCAFCQVSLAERDPLCCDCIGLIKVIPSSSLPGMNDVRIPIYSLGTLEDPLRYLVNSRNPAHSRCLGTLVWRFSLAISLEFDGIVPFMSSPKTLAIAQQLGKLSGKPVIEDTWWPSFLKKGKKLLTLKQKQRLCNKRIVLLVPIFCENLLVWQSTHHLLQADPASLSVLVICRLAKR